MLQETVQTLAESNNATNWIQAGSGFISAIAAAFSAGVAYVLLRQIKLQETQIALSQRQLKSQESQIALSQKQLESQESWNRINASFTYFEDEYLYRLLDEMEEKLGVIGIDSTNKKTLTKSILKQLKKPTTNPYVEARRAIIRVLNFLEAYAIAGQTTPPAIDKKVAREMYGFYIVYWYDFFCEFITDCRKENHDGAYDKLESLHTEWKPSVEMILGQGNSTIPTNKEGSSINRLCSSA